MTDHSVAARGLLRVLKGSTCLAAAALVLGAATIAGAQTPFPSGAGYTAAQAARGKAAYGINCLSCHGANLDDGEFGPPLKGQTFMRQWQGQSAGALFSYISTKMPPSGPGTLNPQVYADVEAYILQANGGPAGAAELSPTGLAAAGGAAAGGASRSARSIATSEDVGKDKYYHQVMDARTAKLDALTPVTKETLENPPADDWLMWRRTYDGFAHSPLKQINTQNAADLGVAWTRTLPLGPDEMTPLVHDGVMFVWSANQVQALDATNGDLLWRYVRPLAPQFGGGHNDPVKTLAVFENKLFVPTPDGHMLALDIHSGKVVWDQAVLDDAALKAHLRLDGGPIVADGKVMMGASGCTGYKGGCFIFGLDAETGKSLWRFNTVARPGDPGGNSWNGLPEDQRYGGSVWTSGTYDPKLNLVYFGVGNTYNTTPLLLPSKQKGVTNDAAYTDSTLALDPDTGKLAWYFQHMNRDVWDMDWVFDRTLVTLPVDGKPTDLVVTAGKIAIFDALDRANGKYAFSIETGLQNLVTAIDPKTGHKTINPDLKPEANVTRTLCPHGSGVRNWQATSYDPATHYLYVAMTEDCTQMTWVPRPQNEYVNGGNDIHWGPEPRPNSDGNTGRIEAINLETRKPAWIRRGRTPEITSMLTTEGGVVFDGSVDRDFRASDDSNGKVLWHTRLNSVPSSTPVTYSVNGTQYVAVVAGAGGAQGGTSWVRLIPEVDVPSGGTTLWVFKLRDKN